MYMQIQVEGMVLKAIDLLKNQTKIVTRENLSRSPKYKFSKICHTCVKSRNFTEI